MKIQCQLTELHRLQQFFRKQNMRISCGCCGGQWYVKTDIPVV